MTDQQLRTHRSLGLLVIGGITFFIGALAAADAVLRATAGARLAVVATGLGAALLSWVFGLRPAVIENPRGVEVRNPIRTAEIPWAAVTDVDEADVVRIHVGDLVVRCFALPRRMRPRRQPVLSFAPRLPGVDRPTDAVPDVGVARRLEDQAATLGAEPAAQAALVRTDPYALTAVVLGTVLLVGGGLAMVLT